MTLKINNVKNKSLYCRAFVLSFLLLVISNQVFRAQDHIRILDQVNNAVNNLQYLHFKTSYISKYYTENEPTFYNSETWIHKNQKDTILGMHIRSIDQYEFGVIETVHKDLTTWVIEHNKDTITRYDQTKDHWDGFNGNIKTDWTTETPLSTGIIYNEEEEDSISIKRLHSGDWVVQVFPSDIIEYSIDNIELNWWIDHTTMLPYRTTTSWKIEGQETWNDLTIELIDTIQEPVLSGINASFPDYPIIDYVKPDPKQFEPLPEGTKVPELTGYLLENSAVFDLTDHLDSSLIMIDFWYQSCGPCIRAIPYLDSLEHEFDDKGFLLLEVNSRDHDKKKKDLMDFVKKRGGQTDMIVMTDIDTEKKIWKSYANPTFYLIREGEIVWTQQGFAPELMPEFRKNISKYIEDK